jgi:hypothetical protein
MWRACPECGRADDLREYVTLWGQSGVLWVDRHGDVHHDGETSVEWDSVEPKGAGCGCGWYHEGVDWVERLVLVSGE